MYCSLAMIWNWLVCLLSSFTAAVFELLTVKYQLEKKWVWTPLCHLGVTSQTLNICTLLFFFFLLFLFQLCQWRKVKLCLLYDNGNKDFIKLGTKHKKWESHSMLWDFMIWSDFFKHVIRVILILLEHIHIYIKFTY